MHAPRANPVAAVLLAAAAVLLGPGPAFPAEGDGAHVDLTRYFATPGAEQADRQGLPEKLAALKTSLEKARNDPAGLEAGLASAEKLLTELHRHLLYLRMRRAVDRSDRATAEADHEVRGFMDSTRDAVDSALLGVGGPTFKRWAKARPALGKHAFLLEQAERVAAHTLPAAEEAIADQIGGPALEAFSELFDQTLRSTPFAQVKTADGPVDARVGYQQLIRSPDRAVREAAFHGRLEGFASHEPIYAELLVGIVRERTALARLRRYDDAPSRVYSTRYLTRPGVDAALQAVAAQVEGMKEYGRLRAANFRCRTGIDTFHTWDRTAPTGGQVPRLTLAEARPVMLAALAPLGPDYVAHFAALVDPANGRTDIGPEDPKRERGGFSHGAPGVPSVLFVGNYQGTLADLSTTIHEGGHAIHEQLMSDGGVPPFYAGGPKWMHEAPAILNGLLLRDHLYRTAKDPQLKAYYLEALVDELTFQVFTSAEEASLEQALFDGVSAGRIRSADPIDALTAKTLESYEIWPNVEPELARVWMTKSLLFDDPLYYVNYLYAGLLAAQLMSLSERDPADFARRYQALLRGGFDAPPKDLLGRSFGLDVPGPAAVADAMTLIRGKVEALEQLYAASQGQCLSGPR